ncbi:MAG: ADP-ribosylation factor GTPase activating protein, ER-Golgi transport [Vezdaea aestivalis]|nr:MAG: ADP-ribosylation factor GTPase activating protein, ER-Golgi transport [Vezdaea aestivalis]
MSATKTESQKIFEKLKSKPANKRFLLTIRQEWQWEQLRFMKVGGNESATKFFQSHGGTAALASKDSKVKYESAAATKYKDELKRRVQLDASEFPDKVVIKDIPGVSVTVTPAADDDDFFSSWDKPTIKRPTPPPSRTATPPVVGRPPPSKSPLSASDPLTAPRATPATFSSRPKKTNILSAKKTQKLGAKKITNAEAIDFDELEKKAKEEAELGVLAAQESTSNSDVVVTEAPTVKKIGSDSSTKVERTTTSKPRSNSELERLGMGMGRLGFGQAKKAGQAPRKMGFGAVGKATEEGDDDETYAREKFGGQKGISSDEFFGRNMFDASSKAEAKNRLESFEGATSISSNAYFGRPEDEGAGNDENYGDLESAAKDFVRRFGVTAGDDLDNLTHVVGAGAVRLQGAIRDYLNS